mgnify:CR=1 FL=1
MKHNFNFETLEFDNKEQIDHTHKIPGVAAVKKAFNLDLISAKELTMAVIDYFGYIVDANQLVEFITPFFMKAVFLADHKATKKEIAAITTEALRLYFASSEPIAARIALEMKSR